MNLWHFTAQPGVLRDGTLFSLGQKLTLEGKIVPCERGFHGSPSVLDALQYAPGSHLYGVDLAGTIVPHGEPIDKYAASERTAIAYLDATDVLRAFARSCALDVIHLWNAPDVVRQYLETGDESVRVAAREAAWAAARDAAREAAWAAWDARDAREAARDAREAAWAAAREAAWDAARDAREAARDAREAAWAAAREAAWDAALAAREAAWAAALAAWDAALAAWDAREAAWDAREAARDAREAARDAQRKRLDAMILKAMEEQPQ